MDFNVGVNRVLFSIPGNCQDHQVLYWLDLCYIELTLSMFPIKTYSRLFQKQCQTQLKINPLIL